MEVVSVSFEKAQIRQFTDFARQRPYEEVPGNIQLFKCPR